MNTDCSNVGTNWLLDMNIEIIREIVTAEGFRPKLDDDGDLVFKFEGGSYFIDVDERDATYIRIHYPNFWALETDEEKLRGSQACVDTSAEIKCAKLRVVNGNVWSSIELVLPDEEAFRKVFTRCLTLLAGSARNFANRMTGTAE